MYTNENPRLTKDGEEINILPNTQFEEIPAGYLILVAAHILNDEGELVATLQPGKITTLIKDTPSMDYWEKNKSELREILIQSEISFPTKATKQHLIELLEG